MGIYAGASRLFGGSLAELKGGRPLLDDAHVRCLLATEGVATRRRVQDGPLPEPGVQLPEHSLQALLSRRVRRRNVVLLAFRSASMRPAHHSRYVCAVVSARHARHPLVAPGQRATCHCHGEVEERLARLGELVEHPQLLEGVERGVVQQQLVPGGGAAVRDDLRGGVHVSLVERGERRAGEVQRCAVHLPGVPLEVLREEAVGAQLRADGHAAADGEPAPDAAAHRQPRVARDANHLNAVRPAGRVPLAEGLLLLLG
mmetsp:Transcript_46298/g.115816  ORF Transcript_46298/g.115816 Transcript_46298/m.115816 type:complete len:258 (+) Transcript_46298:185-958(+)